jgi:hypothetical protein
LITLDFPTLDRPRKAISGKVGEGKCVKSLADSINRAKIRMLTVSSVWGAQGKRVGKINSLAGCGKTWLPPGFGKGTTSQLAEKVGVELDFGWRSGLPVQSHDILYTALS